MRKISKPGLTYFIIGIVSALLGSLLVGFSGIKVFLLGLGVILIIVGFWQVWNDFRTNKFTSKDKKAFKWFAGVFMVIAVGLLIVGIFLKDSLYFIRTGIFVVVSGFSFWLGKKK